MPVGVFRLFAGIKFSRFHRCGAVKRHRSTKPLNTEVLSREAVKRGPKTSHGRFPAHLNRRKKALPLWQGFFTTDRSS
jgi:hypothetical protein